MSSARAATPAENITRLSTLLSAATDTAWEVNLTTEYKIYENLVVNLDAAYVRIDADGDTWHGAEETQYKDNYRFSVLFTYSF